MTKQQVQYGAIQSTGDLGKLARAHRKQRKLTLEDHLGSGQFEHPFPVRIRARQGNCRGREGAESIAHPGTGGGYPTPQDPCIQAAITARWKKLCLTRMALTSGMINDSLGYLWRNTQGQIGFRYDEEWLTQGGFAVSHTLPLRNEDFAPEEGFAHRFFANLLPEGGFRDQVVRDLKIANTDFDLLRTIGGECAGALSMLQVEISTFH